MSSFYIALFRDAPGLVGRLIRWQTRSRYSHAALVFDRAAIASIDNTMQLLKEGEGYDSNLIHKSTHKYLTIEAREFRGVRITEGIVATWDTNVDLFTIKGGLTPEQVAAIWFWAKNEISKKYDYTMVARFISRRQASRAESEKWFCSELQFAALQKAGVELLRDIRPWEASPGLVGKSPLLEFHKTIGHVPLPELLKKEEEKHQ